MLEALSPFNGAGLFAFLKKGGLFVSNINQQRLEVMWGIEILEEGYTQIPNLITRYHRKIGLTPGEWSFISVLLTYKHDSKDPYPSAETLADTLDCSVKQIEKYISSLKSKDLIKVYRTKSKKTGKYGNNIYNFKPLIDAILAIHQSNKKDVEEDEYQIVEEPSLLKVGVGKEEPLLPEVGMVLDLKVGVDPLPQVGIKKKNIKRKSEKENIKSQSVIISNSKIESETIQIAIAKNKKLTDRLTDIVSVYKVIKDEPGYSDALFIATLQKAIKAKISVPFGQYLLKAMINNLSEQQSKPIRDKPSKQNDDLPDYVKNQFEQAQQEVAVTEKLDKEKQREALDLLLQLEEINQEEYERRWNAL